MESEFELEDKKENNIKVKYFIYCRRSLDDSDRQVLSIESQIEELQELASRANLKVVRIFQESMSAKEPGRQIFSAMIKAIRKGEANGIICWKLDRLSRNPIDAGEVQWMLQTGIIKEIKTPSKDYKPEDNVIMMAVEMGMATQYSIDVGFNVKRGLAKKLRDGWKPGLAPAGYLNESSSRRDNKILIDEENFKLIRRAMDLVLSGLHTPAQALEKLNNWGYCTPRKEKRGGGPLAISSWYKTLNDPFYYGEFYWKGKLIKGSHQPMITIEEYDRIQSILGSKGKPRPQKYHFSYTGLIKCGECGGMITAQIKKKRIKSKGGEFNFYTYYHCTKRKTGEKKCSQKAIKVETLENQIAEKINQVAIPEGFKQLALTYLDQMNDEEVGSQELILKNQQKAYESVQRQLNNLTKMMIKEQITEENYLKEKTSLENQRTRIEFGLKRLQIRNDEWRKLTEKSFDFACYAKERFEKGDLNVKKAILYGLGSNFVLINKNLDFQSDKPLEIIQGGFRQIARLEPGKNYEDKTKTEAFDASVSDWSG